LSEVRGLIHSFKVYVPYCNWVTIYGICFLQFDLIKKESRNNAPLNKNKNG
jgi:hypothetical protein